MVSGRTLSFREALGASRSDTFFRPPCLPPLGQGGLFIIIVYRRARVRGCEQLNDHKEVPVSNEEALHLVALADAYRFAGVFLSLPTREVAEGVVSGVASDDLAAVLSEAASPEDGARFVDELSSSAGSDVEETHRALRRDFTRLFTNPEQPLVSIYEACFKKADDFDTSQLTFVSPTALDAERQYRAWGLVVGIEHRESPDHMGAELDFLSYLYGRAAEGAEHGDAELMRRALEAVAEFRRSHFDKWASGFFNAVRDRAQTPAYRAVGELGILLADGSWQ